MYSVTGRHRGRNCFSPETRLFENKGLVDFYLQTGEISNVIDELTNKKKVDLICLRTKKNQWDFFGLNKSFSEKVMDHIKVPIYI